MAVATGDFVLATNQVTPVVRALIAHGVTVTAVHSRLIGSMPELLFVHFWQDHASALASSTRRRWRRSNPTAGYRLPGTDVA